MCGKGLLGLNAQGTHGVGPLKSSALVSPLHRILSEIYLIENGRRRWIRSQEALDWLNPNANQFANVIEVTSAIITSYVPSRENDIYAVGAFGEGEIDPAIKALFTYAYANNAAEPHCASSQNWKGWPGSFSECLRFPVGTVRTGFNSSVSGASAKFQEFGNDSTVYGSIQYSNGKAYVVYGAIFRKWQELGFGQSRLGLPISVAIFDPDGGRPLDFTLVGIIDLIESDEEGNLIISELKTSAKRYADSQGENQLDGLIYAYALDQLGFRTSDHRTLIRYDVLVKTKTPAFQQAYFNKGSRRLPAPGALDQRHSAGLGSQRLLPQLRLGLQAVPVPESLLESLIHTSLQFNRPLKSICYRKEIVMSGTLIAHCGTRKITRDDLKHLPIPEATATFKPVPHHEIVEALVETLAFRQISVVRDDYAASPDGMRMFGVLDLETGFDGCRFSIGLRNSHDKSLRLACVCGLRVMVCDNLAFQGDFTPVLAKHSRRFSLLDSLAIGVDRIQRNFTPLREQVERWRESLITDDEARLVIYEAFIEGELDIPKYLAKAVHRSYFHPLHDAFAPRTMWSLANAFTTALKSLEPIPFFRSTAKLGTFLHAN